MGVQLVNGSVLFPHPADWAQAVTLQRNWQTGLSTAITGAERRQSLRALGREQLSWVIAALTLEERAMLDERLDAASESGLACAPYWGRGSTLLATCNANTAQLTDSNWPWTAGDYVFLMDANKNFDVMQIASLVFAGITADTTLVTADTTGATADQQSGMTITFTANVSRAYAAGLLTWPLLFGKFKMEKQSAVTSWHGDVKLTLAELVARHQPIIGNGPPGGVGIGFMAIGSTNIVN